MNKEELIEKLETIQNMLVAHATGVAADNEEYITLRAELVSEPSIARSLPHMVKTCRDLSQFWAFIQPKFAHYQERREYIWSEFSPLLDNLDAKPDDTPSDLPVSMVIKQFDADYIYQVWQNALARRDEDPEGAITVARTLLESVCKHILDKQGAVYDDNFDLPKLYKLTSEQLNLAPSQHTEKIFKQILGGCQTVIEGLGALRNKLGDAHGKGKRSVRPVARHAELAVNLAGAMATYLIRTWSGSQK
jgi:hypothetical protein